MGIRITAKRRAKKASLRARTQKKNLSAAQMRTSAADLVKDQQRRLQKKRQRERNAKK